MLRILSRDGAAPWLSRLIFKAVVQAVLLFGAENWVFTPCICKSLGGFQAQVVRQLVGRLPWRTLNDRWRYTSAVAASKEAGFLRIE